MTVGKKCQFGNNVACKFNTFENVCYGKKKLENLTHYQTDQDES